MTDFPKTDTSFDQPTAVVPKRRACLRCQAEFQSQWAGERICGRCKGSAAWRTGTPLLSSSGGKQR